MSNKGIVSLLFAAILAVIGVICFVQTLHVNNIQLTVTSLSGALVAGTR